jgi:predicted permease
LTSLFAFLVRTALRLGPQAFRARYGPEILSSVEGALASARREQGHLAAVLLGLRCVLDTVAVVWRERRASRPDGLAAGWRGDAVQAVRSLRRSPMFALTVILTLALSVGLVAATFSFSDGYLFRPLPFPSADRLYFVREPQAPIAAALRATDTLALRDSALRGLGFVEWSVATTVHGSLILADRAIDVVAYEVTPRFRETVPLPLVLGRDFSEQDHLSGRSRTPAWLSHRFWQREFRGDRSVVGRVLQVSGGPVAPPIEIVGVLGAEVTSFDLNNPPPDLVVPAIDSGPSGPMTLSFPIVRLPDDIGPQAAEARINAALQAVAPESSGSARAVQLRPVREYQVRGGQPTARVLFAGALLVILLAAINLLHLLLTRNASRASETAIRAALGASRWRLARLHLVESGLLGLAGVGGGLAVGHWFSSVLADRVPRFPTEGRNLSLVPILFDARVVLFALALGALVVIVSSAGPTWFVLRRPLIRRAHGAGSTADLPVRQSQLFLAAEMVVTVVILVGTVFIGTGIWRYLNAPLGFEYANRFSVSFTIPEPRPPTATEVQAVQGAVSEVAGVQEVGSYGGVTARGIDVPGQAVPSETVSGLLVSAGYGEAWGVLVRRGRWFEPTEFAKNAAVAVVDESFARTVWRGAEPLGEVIRVGGLPRQVVGVIEPMRWRLDREGPGQVFVPAAEPPTRSNLIVWAPDAPADLAHLVEAAVSRARPGTTTSIVPVTFDRLFQRSVGGAQFQAPVMLAFGLVAVVLAGIGVFGVVSYVVAQRQREFGICLALGAQPRDVWRSVIRQSLMPAAAGLIVGVPTAWALERVVRSAAFGWPSTGTGSVLVVAGLLFGISVLAAAIPARRAMRVDPVRVLRSE